MKMKKVTDDAFSTYGKVLEGYDFSGLLEVMKDTPLPEDEVIYVPGLECLEAEPAAEVLKKNAYGGLPIQVGYCNGHNLKLNALEYHRSSEVDIAASDLILLLGRQQDIREDYTYDTEDVESFFVPPPCTMRRVRHRRKASAASSCCRRGRTMRLISPLHQRERECLWLRKINGLSPMRMRR